MRLVNERNRNHDCNNHQRILESVIGDPKSVFKVNGEHRIHHHDNNQCGANGCPFSCGKQDATHQFKDTGCYRPGGAG